MLVEQHPSGDVLDGEEVEPESRIARGADALGPQRYADFRVPYLGEDGELPVMAARTPGPEGPSLRS